MSHRTSVFVAGLLLAGAVVLPAAAGAQTAGWLAPAALGTSNLNFMYANNTSMAVSSNVVAQGIAAWTEPTNMSVRYALRKNGSWTGTKTLYTASSASASVVEEVSDPQVVMDASGNATVVWASWKRKLAYCASGGRVYRCWQNQHVAKAATLPAGATTWTKVTLSAVSYAVIDVQAAVDDAGVVTVVWNRRASAVGPAELQAATATSGAWTVASTIATSAGFATPRLAVGPAGDAVVAWAENTATPSVSGTVNAIVRSAGAWSAPAIVAGESSAVAHLRTTVDGSGRAAIVWTGAGYDVAWARRAGGLWGAPEVLLAANGSMPDVASDRSGRFVLSWLAMGAAADGSNNVEALVVDPWGQTFDAVWNVGTDVAPNIALARDGISGTIAWLDETDNNAYVATLSAANAWSAPAVASTGASLYTVVWGTSLSVAAGDNGESAVGWLSISGLNGQVKIRAASRLP